MWLTTEEEEGLEMALVLFKMDPSSMMGEKREIGKRERRKGAQRNYDSLCVCVPLHKLAIIA